MNGPLFAREAKNLWKMFAVFAGILCVYVPVVIWVYGGGMFEALAVMVENMPGLAEAMGFRLENVTLLHFIAAYLYGFILLACPMLFAILAAHTVIAEHVDRGTMVSLLAAPVPRRTVARTQLAVLVAGVFALVVLSTALTVVAGQVWFPGELDVPGLLLMNVGLLGLHLFIGAVCFLCSCAVPDPKRALGLGAGIPFGMFALQMLGNVGGTPDGLRYLTFFTLFDAGGLADRHTGAVVGAVILYAAALALYATAIAVFTRRDLHI